MLLGPLSQNIGTHHLSKNFKNKIEHNNIRRDGKQNDVNTNANDNNRKYQFVLLSTHHIIQALQHIRPTLLSSNYINSMNRYILQKTTAV